MSIPFVRSMRSLQADGLDRSLRGLVGAGALLLVWAVCLFFARVDVVVVGRGTVRPRDAAVPVMTTVAGRVTEVKVREGDVVHKGQVLAVLESRTTAGEVAQVERERDALEQARREQSLTLPVEERRITDQAAAEQRKLETLQLLAAQLATERDSRTRESVAQRRTQELEVGRKEEELARVRLDLAHAATEVEGARKIYVAYRDLVRDGMESKLHLVEVQTKFEQAVTNRKKLQAAERQAMQEVEQERRRLQQMEAVHETQMADIRRREQERTMQAQAASARIDELNAELSLARRRSEERLSGAEADYRRTVSSTAPGMAEKQAAGGTRGTASESGRITITAPRDGRIVTLVVKQGGTVLNAGEALLLLLAEKSPLEIETWIRNSDIGDVAVGMPAISKLDAFPYEQYGTVAAIVTWVSPDAEPHEGIGLAYRIKCQAKQVPAGIVLQPGLTANVEVSTGRKRVLDLLLQQVLGDVERL